MELEELDEEIDGMVYNDNSSLFSFLGRFKNAIEVLEKNFTREEIIKRIPKIRCVAGDSPLINRAQKWPKGYQGDFETIQHIISQENKAIPGTVGHAIEGFFLNSPICKQHINKVKRQSELISNTLTHNPCAHILSIGCGTSEDLKMNISKIAKSKARITIVDLDKDALHYSLASLEAVKEHVEVIQGNIYKIIKTIKGKFDLVIAGGVFDYLSDRVIINVLSSLKKSMNERGTISFTNIKECNPFRIYMEYLSDWILIERSDGEIRVLLKESGCDGFHTTIQTDDAGLAYLVEINFTS